jgi:tetratricopeptide (TPR) repeat protein
MKIGWLPKIVLTAMAAVAVLLGAMNVRAMLESGPRDWEVDPSRVSATDQLVGAPVRLPTTLDDQILSLQETLRTAPENPVALSLLGLAYLQKVRESGDPSYYPKAETLFLDALKRDEMQLDALIGLGTLALARHEFGQALDWGRQAAEVNPYHAAAYGVIGDAQIELGRYDDAVASFQRMIDLRPDLGSYSRVSYARELYGDADGALVAMEQAATAGAGQAENVAWTQAQIGNLLFNRGDLDAAEAAYRKSIATLDGYVYGVAGLAKVAAARGEYNEAIAGYQSAIAAMPTAEFLIALGDVQTAAGKTDDATGSYALVDAIQKLANENGVNIDLEMALFEADHDRHLPDALGRARAGYAERPSIHGADVLAWTLFKSGNAADAQTYIQEAMRLGTRDALLFAHAGLIEAALGNRDAAISYLQQALTINPHFSVLLSGQVRDELTRLQSTHE